MFTPFPSLMARRPFRARALILKKLETYHEARYYDDPDVGVVAKSNVDIGMKYGLPLDQMATTALGLIFVSNTNAIPTLYWLLLYMRSSGPRSICFEKRRQQTDRRPQKNLNTMSIAMFSVPRNYASRKCSSEN
jgi:hypothetical protein